MNDKLQGSMIALHGPPKIGKTQLVSHFPGPVQFIATEYSHKFITEDQRKRLVQLDMGTGWDTFTSWIDSKPDRANTVSLDTASGLYTLCMEFVGNREGWEYPPSNDHGKGWNAVKREMYKQLSKLTTLTQKMNATLVVIDHSKIETIETTTENVEK